MSTVSDSPKQVFQNDDQKSAVCRPIAICGIGLRLPGGISTPNQFWDFLISKGDARSTVPQSRYNISSYYSETDRFTTAKSKYGYFLDDSVDLGALDTSFFTFTKSELEYIDPQQRQLLEVVRECLENAGEVNYRGKEIGCYVGSFGDDWIENLYHDLQMYGKYTLMVGGDFALPNRISYEYDLRGPNMSIRTACSSALVSVHEACRAIERGDCTAAVVAGCNLIMSPTMTLILSAKGVLSPDGSCKTFDAAADGYCRGEAINAVYLKPLDDAIRDGNPIRAVIKGTAVNSDGKTSGVNAPNVVSQEALIRKAYMAAGIDDISQTAFVECHGTGTAVGDPVEAQGVANTFGGGGIYIGSVKPNVGHSEGASGLTSLIKAVLALEHQVIPPNIKFANPNPKIPFDAMNLKVPIEPTAWPQARHLRASVNAFGMGGVNAHAILESAEYFTPPASPETPESQSKTPHLLVYSANTAKSLERLVTKYEEYIKQNPGALKDLSYTLGARREHLPHRAVSIVNGFSSYIASTSLAKAPSSPPAIVMVFTGQGAQWQGMGASLYKCFSTFRDSILSLDAVLQSISDAPNWSICDELKKDAEHSNLSHATFSQPLCTAVQIALVDLLLSFGIVPYATVGHSSGELAAAYAAGRLTSKQAIIFAFYRGMISGQITKSGGMAAVGLGQDEVSQFLRPGVVVACENSPSSVTLSGDEDEVDKVLQAISASRPDKLVRRLKVSVAYHSHHVKEVGDLFRSALDEHFDNNVVDANSELPLLFSTVTGSLLGDKVPLDPHYWQSNFESPVRFHAAVKSILEHSDQRLLFLEVGPHSALSGPIRQILDEASRADAYVSCLVRSKDCSKSFLSALGQLHCQNISINFNALTNPDRNAKVLTDLPNYCWDHGYSSRYMPRENKEWLWCKHPKHELLGIRVIDSTDNEPSWRNVLHLEHVPWLRDHKVGGVAVFPAAGYVAMVGAALWQLNLVTASFQIRHLTVDTAMVLSDLNSTEILTTLRKHQGGGWYDFVISSHNGAGWTQHCSGQAQWNSNSSTIGSKGQHRSPLHRHLDIQSWYKTLAKVGLDYGPAFQCLENGSSSTTQPQHAEAKLNCTVNNFVDYPVHPTRLDGLFQTVLIAMHKGLSWNVANPHIPIKIEEIDISHCDSYTLNARSWITGSTRDLVSADGEARDLDGAIFLRFKGAVMRSMRPDATLGQGCSNMARISWEPDIQFQRLSELVKPSPDWETHTTLLNHLTTLCVAQAQSRLNEEQVSIVIPHLEKYQAWLKKQPLDYEGTLESITSQLLATPAAPCAVAMIKVLDNIVPICRGDIEPLEVLMADNTLLELYNYLNLSDRSALFTSLGHQRPNQRILEIGAGTGGTTAKIIQHTIYDTYTFTDISAAFFPAAKERFKSCQNVTFKTLDISKDSCSQGFEPQSFDLIVAANVLHASPSLHETLVNVHKLLHPQGTLLLEELSSDTKFTNFVTGVLPGWWDGHADGRADEPYVSPMRWEQELIAAGFGGLDDLAYDATPPFHINAYMLASPYISEESPNKSTILVCDKTSSDTAVQFQRRMRSRGYKPKVQGIEDDIPEGTDVIVLVDTVSPFFNSMDAARLLSFQVFVRKLQESHSGALWVTRSSQLKCSDPRFSAAIGAIRTVRSEFGIDLATCEVDVIKYTNIGLVIDLFEKFRARGNEVSDTLTEQEYVISNETVHIGRMLPFSINNELEKLQRLDWVENPAVALRVGTMGSLDSVVWSPITAAPAIGDDEIDIQVMASGVNVLDISAVSKTTQLLDRQLGVETAGIIQRVGSQVHHLAPGDRVFAIGQGCLATSMRCSSSQCVKVPDGLSLEDAATMPLDYSTAIQSIIEIGQLNSAQAILIHLACSSIGQAAIQITKMVGATIFVTVNSEEELDYLAETYNIPRDQIFLYGDALFPSKSRVMAMTGGQGFDLVLNSVAGEVLQTSCEQMKNRGKIINLVHPGMSIREENQVHFPKPNVSYINLDIIDYVEASPEEGKRLLQTIVKLCNEGHIRPVTRDVATFSMENAKECFRAVQSDKFCTRKHTIVLDPKDLQIRQPMITPKTISFRNDASYLLVGGLGGLGSGLAKWMAEHNARHFIFLSRSAGDSSSDKTLFSDLEDQGCSVSVIKGNVCNESDVSKAISSTPVPLKGIFNIAMVLRDASLLSMSVEEWNAATEPKVQGTWNLHKQSLTMDLDFFVLFSSMCGIFGMPGQANYAAANTFMDAFVQYRHQCRLPASVLDLGAVDGIGHVAENPHILERSKWLSHVQMSQKELFDAVTLAIYDGDVSRQSEDRQKNNHGQIISGFKDIDVDSEPVNSRAYLCDNRMAVYSRSTDKGTTTIGESGPVNELASFVASASSNKDVLLKQSASNYVAIQIARWVFNLLMKPIEDESEVDIARSLADVGFDSLAAVEMRSWWRKTFGLEISVLEIMSFASFSALGQHAVQGLIKRFES